MEHDWYRSPDWDPGARADFEKRLQRARADNRAQYLNIKAHALAEAGHAQGARTLWLRILEDPEVDREFRLEVGAMFNLALSLRDEDPARAEHYLRGTLANDLNEASTLGGIGAQVCLAELLLERGSDADLEESAALLQSWADHYDLPLPNAHFRWNLALIDLALALDDPAHATRAARHALDLAARGPVFPRHKTVGVVDVDTNTLHRLEHLAGLPITPPPGDHERHPRDPLEKYPQYRKTTTHTERQQEQARAELADAEAPIVADLNAAGHDVTSVWDLINTTDDHETALPILLEHLENGDYPSRVLESLGRALAVKKSRTYWNRLKTCYLHPDTDDAAAREAAAIALSACATKNQLEDLFAFIEDPSLGVTRVYFLSRLARLGGPRATALIESLQDDPDLGPQTTEMVERARRRRTRAARTTPQPAEHDNSNTAP